MTTTRPDPGNAQWIQQASKALRSIREALIELVRNGLLGDGLSDYDGDPALLIAPLNDWTWRNTPLVHQPQRIPRWLMPLHQVGSRLGLASTEPDELFEAFMRSRERWAVLPLYALMADRTLVELLYRGTALHWLRTFPLRLQASAERSEAALDWLHARETQPLPWRLSPLVIFYAYGALLVSAASSTSFLERWGGRRSKLLEGLDAIVEHVSAALDHESPVAVAGTLLTADGLLQALSRAQADDDVLARYAQLCSVSRILRAADLPAAAHTNAGWPGLLALASSGANPGLRLRLAQSLAAACELDAEPIQLAVAASVLRALADDQWQSIGALKHSGDVSEALLWSLELAIAIYARAERASNIDDLIRRVDTVATDYFIGVGQSSSIEIIFGPELPSDIAPTARRRLASFRRALPEASIEACLRLRSLRMGLIT